MLMIRRRLSLGGRAENRRRSTVYNDCARRVRRDKNADNDLHRSHRAVSPYLEPLERLQDSA
jgi:hypothetical protein